MASGERSSVLERANRTLSSICSTFRDLCTKSAGLCTHLHQPPGMRSTRRAGCQRENSNLLPSVGTHLIGSAEALAPPIHGLHVRKKSHTCSVPSPRHRDRLLREPVSLVSISHGTHRSSAVRMTRMSPLSLFNFSSRLLRVVSPTLAKCSRVGR